METALKTFEVSIPEEFSDTLKAFVKALKGHVKAERKRGIDESLDDVAAGRIQQYDSFEQFEKDMTINN